MSPEYLGVAIFGLLAVFTLLPLWLMPALKRRQEERELLALNKMHRFARRHNTFVRNFRGVRFVVVLGPEGFRYMLGGQFVPRERLLRALGEENEKVLLKAEGEESRSGPVQLLLTSPA
ncbi:MAG: hypothetical protein NZ849_06410 [Meiothermus sp.]|uniref:hypothetical protein n=1 Tax=Meiothermus sp. TaxID=1955249 RepID=UPI0025DA596C|nr:hypothetical protein [Meiothermus sp.]MCS7057975.1 hypothetical protein [Meiothermus sp.]MCS7194531.1 hypothetical protein [Meiothermus sp.]MCX7740491.1 hypothetical protein [Meiothermus sp.]MDW8091887.1 hypothetical protein [Meiothermus sp.]MDW8480870.1 hypothetical protein [Meiothermus sp.]